jgi:hypothetical protein
VKVVAAINGSRKADLKIALGAEVTADALAATAWSAMDMCRGSAPECRRGMLGRHCRRDHSYGTHPISNGRSRPTGGHHSAPLKQP